MLTITNKLILLSILFVLSSCKSEQLLLQKNAHKNFDPLRHQTTADESLGTIKEKRTIFGNNEHHHAWAKHVKFQARKKIILGFSPVALKKVPVIRPLLLKPVKGRRFENKLKLNPIITSNKRPWIPAHVPSPQATNYWIQGWDKPQVTDLHPVTPLQPVATQEVTTILTPSVAFHHDDQHPQYHIDDHFDQTYNPYHAHLPQNFYVPQIHNNEQYLLKNNVPLNIIPIQRQVQPHQDQFLIDYPSVIYRYNQVGNVFPQIPLTNEHSSLLPNHYHQHMEVSNAYIQALPFESYQNLPIRQKNRFTSINEQIPNIFNPQSTLEVHGQHQRNFAPSPNYPHIHEQLGFPITNQYNNHQLLYQVAHEHLNPVHSQNHHHEDEQNFPISNHYNRHHLLEQPAHEHPEVNYLDARQQHHFKAFIGPDSTKQTGGSVEYHGKAANLIPLRTSNQNHHQQIPPVQPFEAIDSGNGLHPGYTDVQLPTYLPEHPNYQPAPISHLFNSRSDNNTSSESHLDYDEAKE